MKKNIKFEIELDEKSLPLNIKMSTTDSKDSIDKIKSLMFSSWDSTKKETLRLDLWTKDMPVNEMFIMYYQTLRGMAITLEKSTNEFKLANALRDYCEFFAEKTKIKKTKNSE